jgi:hypothetical protein
MSAASPWPGLVTTASAGAGCAALAELVGLPGRGLPADVVLAVAGPADVLPTGSCPVDAGLAGEGDAMADVVVSSVTTESFRAAASMRPACFLSNLQ